MAADFIRVVVWDENPKHASVDLYPDSIRGAIAKGLHGSDLEMNLELKTACLDDPHQGLDAETLDSCDVLVWWDHARQHEVDDGLVERIRHRVHTEGMGLVALHSACQSKPFRSVLGCEGSLLGGWREASDTEDVRVCAPWHPIAKGIRDFTIKIEEMYGAPFDVPPPTTVVFQSHFPEGGESFPSGLCWTVGAGIDKEYRKGVMGTNQGVGIGRVFYFRPGHETHPTYFDANVRRVIYNAVLWAGKII